MTLDDARKLRRYLGFALYAYDANGPVTLEVHTPIGEVYTFIAASEAEAFNLAFPAPELSQMESNTDSKTNVFD